MSRLRFNPPPLSSRKPDPRDNRLLTIRAMSDGKGYSSRHLEHSDYYAEGERVVGHWRGRGAKLLGLVGEVKSEEFEALREGLDPHTGEFLRQRQSADRVASDG